MTITINRLPGYGDPIVLDVGTLVEADLSEADLRGADLSGADLYGANLRGANLRGAYLRGAELTRANLTGASLTGATLTGAKIHNDTLSSLLTRAGRSDGYEFLAFRLEDGSTKIMAGCRWLTPEEYREHVETEYPGTDKARETLDIIEFIERRARR